MNEGLYFFFPSHSNYIITSFLDVDLLTPPLDGTISPGITRSSSLYLAQAHTTGTISVQGVSPSQKLYT